MRRHRLNVWISAEINSAINQVARDRYVSVTQAVNDLLVDAISRLENPAVEAADMRSALSKLETLVSRTYYLIIATNLMLKHHPTADLKVVMEQLFADGKFSSKD